MIPTIDQNEIYRFLQRIRVRFNDFANRKVLQGFPKFRGFSVL